MLCIFSPMVCQVSKVVILKNYYKSVVTGVISHYHPPFYSDYFIHHLHCIENKAYPAGYYKTVIS